MKNYSNFKTQLNHHLPRRKFIFDQFSISRNHKTPKRAILGQFLFHGSQILCRRFQTIKTNHRVKRFHFPAEEEESRLARPTKTYESHTEVKILS